MLRFSTLGVVFGSKFDLVGNLRGEGVKVKIAAVFKINRKTKILYEMVTTILH